MVSTINLDYDAFAQPWLSHDIHFQSTKNKMLAILSVPYY